MNPYEPWRVPLILFVLGGIGVAWFGVQLRNLQQDAPHPMLDRLEWLAPVRGKWLRILLMAAAIPLLAASIVALAAGGLAMLALIVIR